MISTKKMFNLNHLLMQKQYRNAKAEQVKWELKVTKFRNNYVGIVKCGNILHSW